MPSCPIEVLSRQSLLDVLAKVSDPRARRGVRYPVVGVLALAVVGVLAGARSLLAVWQHATHMDHGDLEALGLPAHRPLPSESTIRRLLAAIDPDVLDRLIATWMHVRTGVRQGRRVIAVDGKTMRGARPSPSKKKTKAKGKGKGKKSEAAGPGSEGEVSAGAGRAPHLLAALDQDSGTVIAQEAVGARTNEIPALRDLLANTDLTEAVVTADALHTQRETVEWIRSRGGHFVLTVKGNQPGLCEQLERVHWKNLPATKVIDTSHGRRTCRTIRATQVPPWVDFPHVAQVLQMRRTRTWTNRQGRRRQTREVVYLICSLPMLAAQPHQVAAWVQGHWGIENRLHWVRDVTFNEDRHQLRTGNGPHVMATLRNTAISLIRLTYGPHASIAERLRHLTYEPSEATRLVTAP